MPRFAPVRIGSPRARAALGIAATLALLALTLTPPPAEGQQPMARPRASSRQAAVDPIRHLHRSATAFGRIDLARLRAFRHFRDIVRFGVRELDAPSRTVSRVRALLEHTDSVYVSLVRGPGRTADFATVLLHGTYAPAEVPSTLEGLLPGVLAGLWDETTIEGLPAYDVGVGALVRLSDRDWLLARRIEGELPVTPREPPAALASADYARLAGLARLGQGAAEGVLVGDASTNSVRVPPEGPGFLYHRTRAAYGRLALDQAAEARFAFEMHDEEGARWRAGHLAEVLERVRRNIIEEQGGRGAPMSFSIDQRGATVDVAVALDPGQLDAYVARFLAGRLLSPAPVSATTPDSPAGGPSQ